MWRRRRACRCVIHDPANHQASCGWQTVGCASRSDAHGARAQRVGTRERIARHQHTIQCVLSTIVFSLLMPSKYLISARKLFCCCLVPQVGVVAMVKSSTSYLWFLVTFHHNQICGLAVAFKNCFVGCLPSQDQQIDLPN